MVRVGSVVVAVSAGLLCGCAGVLPPKPLPEWAMIYRAETDTVAIPRSLRAVARSSEPLRQSSARLGTAVKTSAPSASSHTEARDELRFTDEWYAREEAIDKRLRERMKICERC